MTLRPLYSVPRNAERLRAEGIPYLRELIRFDELRRGLQAAANDAQDEGELLALLKELANA